MTVPAVDIQETDGAETVRRLLDRYGELDGLELLQVMIGEEFKGRIAVLSSFGAEAVALLDLVARVDKATPVIFINTLRHFPETLRYVDKVVEHLGLTDLRRVSANPEEAEEKDPIGDLWRRDRDSCCHMRKVEPLDRALVGMDAWVTGRKRFHGDKRADLPVLENQHGRVKINPLVNWTHEKIEAYIEERGLPRHPMVEEGFLSISCMSCTTRTEIGQGVRSGRWAGTEKTECGIHYAPLGQAKKQ